MPPPGPVRNDACCLLATRGGMDTTILVVDDSRAYRDAVLRMLTAAGFEVVAVLDDGEKARGAARPHGGIPFDVALIDVALPGISGIETAQLVFAARPGCRILGLSISPAPDIVAAMLGAGACGYVVKDDAPRELAAAIRIAVAGGMYLSSSVDAVGAWKRPVRQTPG